MAGAGTKRGDGAARPDRSRADESGTPVATEVPVAGRGRGRARRAALIVSGVFVVMVAAGLVMVFGGERPLPRSGDEALDRFRGEPTTAPASGAASGRGAPVAPAAGVYAYRGSGSESTSLPPLVEQEGPEMPATVVAGADGCWTFRIDYNTHHWQQWDLCPGDDGWVNTGGETFARRDFVTFQVDNLSTFSCPEPPPFLLRRAAAGTAVPGSCSGTNSVVPGETTVAGSTTVIAEETLVIGGAEVRARHVLIDHTVSGAQRGSSVAHWWFDADTGLPLRNERSVRIETDTPFGSISYTEDASFELSDLAPTT